MNTFASPVEEAAVAYVDEHALAALGHRLGEAAVMVVHESSGYGRSRAEETVAALNRRGKSSADVLSYDYRYGAGYFDADAVAKRIGAVAPTVLFARSFVADAVELLKAMHHSCKRPPIVMTSSAGFGLYTLNLAGTLTEGVLSANAPALVASAALTDSGRVLQAEFIRTLKGVSGREPSGFNAMSFCATWALLADVLPKASALDDAEALAQVSSVANLMSCYLQNPLIRLKIPIRGEHRGIATRGHRTNEEVGIGALYTSGTALIEELGGQLIVVRKQPQVRECTELVAQPFVLLGSTNPRQQFLPDRPNHDDAVIDDQALQFIGDSIVSKRESAPEDKRPDRRIDKNFHATRRCFL